MSETINPIYRCSECDGMIADGGAVEMLLKKIEQYAIILANTQAQRDTAYTERAKMRDEYLELANRATALEIENHLLKQEWPQRAAALDAAMTDEDYVKLPMMTGAMQ